MRGGQRLGERETELTGSLRLSDEGLSGFTLLEVSRDTDRVPFLLQERVLGLLLSTLLGLR